MGMNTYEALYAQMQEELKEVEAGGLPELKHLSAGLMVVRKYLGLLRKGLEQSGFADGVTEVKFFKSVKPQFYQWLIYYQERFAILSERPVEPGKEQLRYFAGQLKYFGRFFRQHAFHYQYYKMAATELDHLWFVRGAADGFVLDAPEVNPAFATTQDYLFSKFMAYELLQAWVLEQMAGPAERSALPGLLSRKGVETRWTGDTCNLVEMIYGIYETRQVNAGEVDLSDLMDVFEQVFRVNLSRYFRRFTEIKRRKTISKTKFLDQMREAVNKKIDDSDALPEPKKRDAFLEGNKYL